MEKSNFDLLMQRYLAGEASEQERTKIEAWLDVMKTKKTTDLELSKADEEKLFRKITKNANNLDEVISFLPKQDKKTNTSLVMQIAATVLILISVSYMLWNFKNKDSDILKVTSINGIEKIILNDGTLVWLHKGSNLTYFEKQQDGIRYAQLQGEALFEVAKDANHPFIITCGDVNLKVLGTSFSVKTNNDSLQLIVLTGKVNLSTSTNKEGINVEHSEKAFYKKNGEIEKLKLYQSDISTVTANTEYNMQFNNTSMEEVAEKIGKKFNVEVSISGKQTTRCRITADFTDHSLESTLKLITEVLDVSYTQNGNTITISGTGCK
jgi:ferric-dicitrate binding protein FerR (iron transport regulator)